MYSPNSGSTKPRILCLTNLVIPSWIKLNEVDIEKQVLLSLR